MAEPNRPTLITINLLPEDRSRLSLDWLPKAVTYFVVLVVLAVAVSINMFVYAQNLRLRHNIQQHEHQIAQLEDKVKEVKEIQQEIDVLHQKEDYINELVLNRMEWARKLNQLADILPAQIWLERVAVENVRGAGENQRALVVVGITTNLEQARSLEAALIKNIENSPMGEGFKDVDLVSSGRATWEGDRRWDVWRFELRLILDEGTSRSAALDPARVPAVRKGGLG